MKNLALRSGAMLLAIWYCFSVIGFDVHTCKASSRSFVSVFANVSSCEDIHPDHACGKGHCCSSAHGCCDDETLSLKAESCCSDDYLSLSLTGTSNDSQRLLTYLQPESFIPSFLKNYLVSVSESVDHDKYSNHKSRLIVPGDFQSLLRIWRI